MLSTSNPQEWTVGFDLVREKLQSWLESFIAMLPNLAVALLVVLLFWLLSRFVRSLVGKAFSRITSHKALVNLVVTISGVLVIAIGLFVALSVLQLDRAVTSLLAGAGVIGLALGFAFQDIAANFMSGVLISMRQPFYVGELIETGDFFGNVETINLRSTILRLGTGEIVIIPNKQIFENPITNFTRGGRRRIDLSCGVAYGDDLRKARDVIRTAIEGVAERDPDRDVDVVFDEFGGSSINFKARFWIAKTQQGDYGAAQSEAIIALKSALDEAGFTIPFPIRTLDFGVVGGERLDEVLGPMLPPPATDVPRSTEA